MSYEGLFYLRELETFSGMIKDVYLKPAYIRLSIAPKPSKVLMVSYSMHYWVGDQPTDADWDAKRVFVSPYRPIDNVAYSSRLKFDSSLSEISEEIRRHFTQLVSIGRNAYSEEDGFGLIMEKNITAIELPLDDKHRVRLHQILLVKDYTSISPSEYTEPANIVGVRRDLVNIARDVIYTEREDMCIEEPIHDRESLLQTVRSIYECESKMDSMRKFYPSLEMQSM